MSEETIQTRLEAAANGLLYPSESDEPFTFVRLPGIAKRGLGPRRLLKALELPPETPIREQTVSAFFEGVPGDDFAALRQALKAAVPGFRVFRVGEVQVQVYLLGKDGEDAVGLKTVS